MEKEEVYLKVIEELVGLLLNTQYNASDFDQVYFRTLTLIENIYGKNDKRISDLSEFKIKKFDIARWNTNCIRNFRDTLSGILKSIKCDIENGLIFNIEKQTIGSVVADFLTLSKMIIEEGNKDVAAVLAAAAIEDSLKRYAMLNGLQIDDKDMSEVINALKSQGLIKGPQASLLSSYTKTRNKAFHAEWDKIEIPEVKSLITFTEEFILKNLS